MKVEALGMSMLAKPGLYSAAVHPQSGGRTNTYDRQGLTGRRTREGVYRFRRQDGKSLNMTVGFVTLASPWDKETVLGYVPVCKVHGLLCLHAGDDCKVVHKLTLVKRWCAFVWTIDSHVFEVHLMAKPNKKKPLLQDMALPTSGAAFFVSVLSSL